MAEQKTAATMFNSVLDIFKPKAVTSTTNGDPKTNVSVPNADTLQNTDGTGPKAIPAAGEGDKSPLDGYAKLWETADTDGKPLSLTTPINADPAKLLAAAKTVDFTKAISPELLEKASKGDAASLSELVNQAAQTGYAQSALATTKILEAALNQQATKFQNEVMPEILRRHSIGRDLRTENPIFDNPALKPMLSELETQLAIKYPNASAAEVSSHAKTILTGMAEDIIKQSGRTVTDTTGGGGGTPKASGEVFDWESHFLGKPQGS